MKRFDSDVLGAELVRLAEGGSAPPLAVSPRLFHETLRTGLRASFIQQLSVLIPFRVISESLGISARTLRNKVTKNTGLSTSQSDALYHLVKTWHELLAFFDNDRDLLLKWLSFELSALDNAKPEELLSTAFGRKVLTSFIDEMRYGEFA